MNPLLDELEEGLWLDDKNKKVDQLDASELPAFARRRNVKPEGMLGSNGKEEDFDPSDTEVPAYKRTSPDKGKSIEDAARKGRLEFSKPSSSKSKWDVERERKAARHEHLKKFGGDYDEKFIPPKRNEEDPRVLSDIENIIKRIRTE